MMRFSLLRKAIRQTTALGIVSGLVAAPAFAGAPGASPFDQLPNARAGECFARVMIPAQYETRYKDVVVDEGGVRIRTQDARFGTQSEQILIRDGATRFEVRQPVYKTVYEKIMVRPAYERLAVEEAQYRTVTEEVQIAPARTAWKPGKSLADWSGVKATKNNLGEVYCLVEIPPETKTVTKRVQVRPQSAHTITVPPVYRTITRHVLVDPGGVREVPVSEQYSTITTQRLVEQASSYREQYAPRTERMAYRVEITPARYQWIKVLCKTNATPSAITGLQSQLQQLGYYHGQESGELDLETENAVRKYQQAVGIPHGGYMSLDTMAALHEGRRAPIAQATAHAEAYASASSSAVTQTFYPNASTPRETKISRVAPIRPAQTIRTTKRLHWAGKQ